MVIQYRQFVHDIVVAIGSWYVQMYVVCSRCVNGAPARMFRWMETRCSKYMCVHFVQEEYDEYLQEEYDDYVQEGIAGSASPFCFLLLVGGMPHNPGGGI